MENKQFETKAIRAQLERTEYNEHSVPLFLTSSFVFDTAEDMRAAFNDESDDFIYSRYVNPNTNEFINKVCLLEGAEAGLATASGMAAIFTSFMALLKSGLRIHEAYKVNYETSSVIGKGDKERFTAFSFPKHLQMPSEYHVRGALQKLGLKPHSLRKLLATKLSRSDLRHADIMQVMGWSSIATASKYFQSLNEEQLKQKMKEIVDNE